jgi:hypothetical protein
MIIMSHGYTIDYAASGGSSSSPGGSFKSTARSESTAWQSSQPGQGFIPFNRQAPHIQTSAPPQPAQIRASRPKQVVGNLQMQIILLKAPPRI